MFSNEIYFLQHLENVKRSMPERIRRIQGPRLAANKNHEVRGQTRRWVVGPANLNSNFIFFLLRIDSHAFAHKIFDSTGLWEA